MPGYFGDRWDETSPSAARDYDAYANGRGGPSIGPVSGTGDPGLIERVLSSLFRRQQPAQQGIMTEQLPAPAGYVSVPDYTPPPVQVGKATTKLRSADALRSQISQMIGMPQEAPMPDFGGMRVADFNPPLDPYGGGAPPTSFDSGYGGMSPPIPQRPRQVNAGWFGMGGFPQRRAQGGEIFGPRGYFSTGGGSNYVGPDGQGDGRSDHVEARLSPGEYVIDAETVSLLGNGDNDAGARALDALRQSIRKQKGKALAQGKFSPDAKDAEAYLPDGDE